MPVTQLIIQYRAAATPADVMGAAQIQRLSAAAGVAFTYGRPMAGDAHVVRLPGRTPWAEAQAISERLRALPEVLDVEPDGIRFHATAPPNDPRYNEQWHYAAPATNRYGINAPAAWDVTTGSASVVVAVLDTGITGHADFAGRTVPGYDFISDSRVANDGNGRDNDPSDPGDWITAGESSAGYFQGCQVTQSSWHGTHTAGTIGAATNNGIGVAGINWHSMILPVRVLGKCGGADSDIIDGMYWAAGLSVPGAPANPNPAKVLSLSLGGKAVCSSFYQNAINAILAAGATVVVAAGNSNANAVDYTPANCNGVITVAATNRAGSRAYYSNYGSVVEISAPGGEVNLNSANGVLSTLNTGAQGPVADTYAFYQGTSMATPHVAGVASLLYSLNPAISPAQVMTILQNTATSFPAGSTCNTSVCGSGIVNAGAAVAALQNPLPAITALAPQSAMPGGSAFTLTVNGTGFVAGSLVRWDGVNRPTTFVSATQLTAAIDAANIATAGTANVTVFNPAPGGGTSNAAPFVIGNPIPVITGFNPPWIAPDSGAFSLTVYGVGFVNGATVRWNGANRTTTFVGPTQLTAAITASDIASGGAANITVANPAPGGGESSARAYLVGAPKKVRLPVMLKNFPPLPAAPALNPINNADGDGNYTVSWAAAAGATSYVLEEDDNGGFTSPATVYSGAATSWAVSNKPDGTYFYRVQGVNTWGAGSWSNTQSATVFTLLTDIVNGDFEAGPSHWIEYSTHGWSLITNSFPGGMMPRSGSWAVWLGGENDEVAYIAQQVTVPPGRPYLTYWHWIASEDTCGYDFGGVIINDAVVDVYDLCGSAATYGWTKHSVNLSAYAGQQVAMQIRVETDSAFNSNLFVDDVAFQATATTLAAGSSTGDDPAAILVTKQLRRVPRGNPAPGNAQWLLRSGLVK